jgi:predicted 2-oxoglutarate/Fe(II)-dependent dioxygenase YbiX
MSSALSDYIVHLPAALPVALCQAVLAEYRDAPDWQKAQVDMRGVQREVRAADRMALSERDVIARNRSVRQRLDDSLAQHTGAVLRRYQARFERCMVGRGTGFELLRYGVGGHYRQHTDSFHAAPRELACSFALNDDYEGGGFAFFDRAQVFTLGRGDALVFPANFMFPHEVLPVTAGTRYAIVTWFV